MESKNPTYSDWIFRIQKRIPIVSSDALTLLFQFLMIEVCVFSFFMWFTQGYDTTVHWWFYQNGWATQEMAMYEGIGIHWSTLFYISLFSVNMSFYLKKKLKVVGFHNIGFSLIIGYWVSAMMFELIYVPIMDWCHNFAEVTRFPILLSGWNTMYLGASGQAGAEAPRWIIVACILYPLTIATLVLFGLKRYGQPIVDKYGMEKTTKIVYGTFAVTYIAGFVVTLWFVTNVGIFPVLIRNLGWFFGLVMAHALITDALQNPAVHNPPKDFTYGWRDKKVWFVLAIFLVGFVVWVLYPITPLQSVSPAEIIKGRWFPQTVYAFYEKQLPIISNQIWVENVGIWFINHIWTKPLAGLFTCLLFAPRLKK